MEFILDTNAYRTLARHIPIEEILRFTNNLRESNRKFGATPSFSIVVSMELMQHLRPRDYNYNECFRALYIMVNLTKRPLQRFTYFKNHTRIPYNDLIRYTLPMNFILLLYYFNENPPESPLLWKVQSWAQNICDNYNQENCLKYQEIVNVIDEQIKYQKKCFKIQVENLIKSHNNGILDWMFYNKKENKEERLKLLSTIHGVDGYNLLAKSMYIGALNFWNRPYESEPWEAKKDQFVIDFKPALDMTIDLLDRVVVGSPTLASVRNKKWNSIMDIELIMGSMFNSPTGEQRILVTLDGPLTKSIIKSGYDANVMTLWDYLNLMNIHL